MSDFVSQLRSALQDLTPLPHRLFVGVSGGADSVALFRGLLLLAEEFELSLQVAHFNHQTRGDDSRADQQWVEDLCATWEIECVTGQRTCPTGPADSSGSVALPISEERLRQERFAFLTATAIQRQFTGVCLGHHAQDQLETLLHRLLRGSSLAGLGAMSADRPLTPEIRLIRPLLTISPATIRQFLTEMDQPFREDVSNRDRRYTRNQLRHDLLPLLDQIQPAARENLLRFQQQAAEVSSYLEQQARPLLSAARLGPESSPVRLRLETLQSAPPLLVRELFRLLWIDQHWPRQGMTAAHWERLEHLARGNGTAADFPGRIRVTRRGAMLVLEPIEPRQPE